MVSSISNNSSQSVTPHQDNQAAIIEKRSKAIRQDENRQLDRQEESRQQQIRVERNRADAESRAGRSIDVIV